MKEREILSIFPGRIRERFQYAADKADLLQEIRLAANMPVRVICQGREFFLKGQGCMTEVPGEGIWCITPGELQQIFDHICHYSRYAFEEDIRQGFLTVPGGHRIGLAGQVLLNGDGSVRNIGYIRYMNIRIAHEILGAADGVMPLIHENGKLLNTLLIGPPCSGKTTMLRDLIRQVSDGSGRIPGKQTGVVDERSEIAGSYAGLPGNRMGIRTDVLDACPKAKGIMMLIRSMSPEVIAVDEIGSREDMEAIMQAQRCGCRIIATLHGDSMEDVKCRRVERDCFDRYVLLKKEEGSCRIHSVLGREEEIFYA